MQPFLQCKSQEVWHFAAMMTRCNVGRTSEPDSRVTTLNASRGGPIRQEVRAGRPDFLGLRTMAPPGRRARFLAASGQLFLHHFWFFAFSIC